MFTRLATSPLNFSTTLFQLSAPSSLARRRCTARTAKDDNCSSLVAHRNHVYQAHDAKTAFTACCTDRYSDSDNRAFEQCRKSRLVGSEKIDHLRKAFGSFKVAVLIQLLS